MHALELRPVNTLLTSNTDWNYQEVVPPELARIPTHMPNVIVVMIDTLSRAHFHRSLPLSVKALKYAVVKLEKDGAGGGGEESQDYLIGFCDQLHSWKHE